MSDELRPLREWLAAHPDPAERIATVAGGETVVPHPIYGRTTKAFWAAMKGVPGWTYQETGGYFDVTHRWLRAAGKRTVTPDDFTRMDRTTVLHFLRWIDRGERFCDGHWAGCLRQGLMHAAARALIAHGPAPVGPAPAVDERSQGELF